MWGKNEGACVPRCAGRNPPRASACRRAPPAEWTSRRGRPKGAAMLRPVRHLFASKARAWPSKVRVSGRRGGGASLDGHRVRLPRGVAMIEQVRHRAMGSAGAGRAAAAVGKRRRERDAELQIQAPRLTVRRYEKWGTNIPGRTTVGGRRRTSRSAVARKACVCAMRSAVQGAAAAQTRACRFFHPHPPSVAARRAPAGRKGGPISSASGSFSSLCWSWGRRARRRRREAARARRGERHRPCGAARRAVRRA